MSTPVDILLVDDRVEGLVTLEAVLADPGYNLYRANSGMEALAQILAHDFALILMDVQMPGMDGFETARVIKQRERSRNIPIIFVTAVNSAGRFAQDGYSVGAVDYLLKPFDPRILKSKVAVFADLFRKSQQLARQGELLRDVERRDRSRVLAELESESRRRYQNLADAIPQIVLRAGPQGGVEYLNHFWHVYTGATLEESVGDGWLKAFHPDDRVILEEKWSAAQKTSVGFEVECRLKRKQDGVYRWHIVRMVPESKTTSEVMGWIGTALDVHDQKSTEAELLRAKEVAESANQAKSSFLANMSHEIRTPLGAMLGFMELMVSGDLGPAETTECIETIRRNGEQLSTIIDDILDLSKVEAGRLDVEGIEVSLIDLLKDVRSSLSLVSRKKGLQLEFKIDGQIPTRIISDPTRLRQILMNVIGNAIKFSTKGNVEVNTAFAGHHLSVAVRDSGPGLTAKQVKDLFQPFSQADVSTTRKYGGTGLGLALSRKLARAMGGDIAIKESAPGVGSCFVISISATPVEGAALTDSMAQLEPEAPVESLKSRGNRFDKATSGTLAARDSLKDVKILLAEDSADMRLIVSRVLKSAGAKVDLAFNGREAVDKATPGDHDLILMDIQMPELDGYDATRALRQQGYVKPIIALTAHAMKEDHDRCVSAGCNTYLMKPVDFSLLIRTVGSYASQGTQPAAASHG